MSNVGQLAWDTFTRANQSGWGTADDGNAWAHPTGSATLSIASNEGKITNATSYNIMTLGSTSIDANVLVRVSMASPVTNYEAGVILRATGATTFYVAFLYPGGNALYLYKVVSGTFTNLGSGTASFTANTFYWLRFQAVGPLLYAKYWADGTGEPSTWTVQGSDTQITAAGNVGCYVLNAASGDTVQYDNFYAVSYPLGSYNTQSLSDSGSSMGGPGPTDSLSLADSWSRLGINTDTDQENLIDAWTTGPLDEDNQNLIDTWSEAGSNQVYTTYRDTFARANQSGWGTSSDGEAWTHPQGGGTLAIASNEGTFTGQSGVYNVMLLQPSAAADVDITCRMSISSPIANCIPGIVLRYTASNTYYLADLYPGGGQLYVYKVIAGNFTALATSPFTFTSSTYYWLRFRISGTLIQVRAWVDGTPEPTTWPISFNDTAISGSGGVGLFALIAANTDTIYYDNFTATNYQAANYQLSLTDTWSVAENNLPVTDLVGALSDTWSDAGIEPAVTSIGTDTFTRANQSGWGTASDTINTWNHVAGAGTANIASNEGTLTGANIVDIMLLGGLCTDTNIRVRYATTDPTNSHAGLFLRWFSGFSGYAATIHGGNALYLYNYASGNPTILATIAITPITASAQYWIRAQIVGSLLSMKVWPNGAPEPIAWTIQYNDTGSSPWNGPSSTGIYSYRTSVPCTDSFDSYTAITWPAVDQQYLQDAWSDVGSASLVGTYQDTFTRANQSGWGVASDGEMWTHPQGTGTLAIASNEGTFTGQAGVNNVMLLNSAAASDVDITCRMTMSSPIINCIPGIVFRYTTTNTYYYAALYPGGNELFIEKVVAGTSTTLATTTFIFTSSTYYWLRVRMVGSLIQIRAWADGTSEPTLWQLSVTDTAIAGFGGVGLYALTAVNADILSYDNFTATNYPSMGQNNLYNNEHLADFNIIDSAPPLLKKQVLINPQSGSDTFVRANQSGWGSAANGLTWRTDRGTPTLAITSNRGALTTSTIGQIVDMILGYSIFYNGTVQVRCQVGTAGGNSDVFGVTGRYYNTALFYSARWFDNVLTLYVNNTSETLLAQAPFTITTGQSAWIQLGMNGSTITAAAWLDGNPQPATPQLTVTDTTIPSPGNWGIYMLTQFNDTSYFDQFAATPSDPSYWTVDSPYGGSLYGGNDPTSTVNRMPLTDIYMMQYIHPAPGFWYRYSVPWAYIQPTSTSAIDWSMVDDMVAWCNYYGINVDFGLIGPPSWATIVDACDNTYSRFDPTKAATFAAAVAARYNGTGPYGYVASIEAGNEEFAYKPLASPCYTADGTYASQLIQAVYPAVKAVHPACLVGTAATYNADNEYEIQWYNNWYAAGGKGYNDFFQMHVYPAQNTVYTLANYVNPSYQASYDTFVQAFRRLQLANNDGNTPLWITETGWYVFTSGGPTGNGVTASQQAANLTEVFEWGRNRAGITHMFWYSLPAFIQTASPLVYYPARDTYRQEVAAYPTWQVVPDTSSKATIDTLTIIDSNSSVELTSVADIGPALFDITGLAGIDTDTDQSIMASDTWSSNGIPGEVDSKTLVDSIAEALTTTNTDPQALADTTLTTGADTATDLVGAISSIDSAPPTSNVNDTDQEYLQDAWTDLGAESITDSQSLSEAWIGNGIPDPIDSQNLIDTWIGTGIPEPTDTQNLIDTWSETGIPGPTDNQALIDSLQLLGVGRETDNETLTDTPTSMSTTGTPDSLSLGETWSEAGTPGPTDNQALLDVYNLNASHVDSDLETLIETWTSMSLPGPTDNQNLTDSPIETGTANILDGQALSETWTSNGIPEPTDNQALIDAIVLALATTNSDLEPLSDIWLSMSTAMPTDNTLSTLDAWLSMGTENNLDQETLSETGTSFPSLQNSETDQEYLIDSYNLTRAATTQDNQSLAEQWISMGTSNATDLIGTLTDLWSGLGTASVIDTQALLDAIAQLITPAADTTSLVLADIGIATGNSQTLNFLGTVTDSWASMGIANVTDAQLLSDTLAVTSVVASSLDTNALVESWMTMGTDAIIDILVIIESGASYVAAPAVATAAISLGRDGHVYAIGHDGKVTALGRSGSLYAVGG